MKSKATGPDNWRTKCWLEKSLLRKISRVEYGPYIIIVIIIIIILFIVTPQG